MIIGAKKKFFIVITVKKYHSRLIGIKSNQLIKINNLKIYKEKGILNQMS